MIDLLKMFVCYFTDETREETCFAIDLMADISNIMQQQQQLDRHERESLLDCLIPEVCVRLI